MHSRDLATYLSWVFCAAVLAVGGCHRTGGKGHAYLSAARGKRIVTLSPALSQMVMRLGDGKDLVGVTNDDDVAPAGLPAVGMYFNVDSERLLSLRPTLLLMMSGRAAVPSRLRQLASDGDFRLVRYPYPNRLVDIGWILAHRGKPSWKKIPNVPSLGQVLGQQAKARRLAAAMFARLKALKHLTGKWKKQRVLLVIGTNPLMASGPGTVNDQLLHIAGGVNVAQHASIRAPTYGREMLLKLNPQVVIFLQPGAPALKPDDARLAEFRGLNLPAIDHHHVYVLNNTLALLPALSVVHTACEMAAMIHPHHAAAIKRMQQEAGGE